MISVLLQEGVSKVKQREHGLKSSTMPSSDDTVNLIPFEGLLASRVECQCCRYLRPIKHESFFSLSLPIPGHSDFTRKMMKSTANASASAMLQGSSLMKKMSSAVSSSGSMNELSIYDCLDSFTAGEQIEDVICPSCTSIHATNELKSKVDNSSQPVSADDRRILSYLNSLTVRGDRDQCIIDIDEECLNSFPSSSITRNDREGEGSTTCSSDDDSDTLAMLSSSLTKIRSPIHKQHSLSRYPEILCLHLCRRVYSESSGQIVKVNKHVQFPLQLDLSKYFFFKDRQQQVGLDTQMPRYRLVAVVVHLGSADSGHYATYCSMEDRATSKRCWNFFSDDRVQRVEEAQVLSSQAYLLFYERIMQQSVNSSSNASEKLARQSV
jgi:ubiquitin C-terminal hydrolase